MFAKSIIDSDAFLDMPLSTQCLYFHLSMRADDDGFINNSKKIQRVIGASDDDMKLLVAKHFIIPFESGVIVIKHWKIHNYIQGDRYKSTVYKEEKALLKVKENKAYTLSDTTCIQNGYSLEAQVRLGKDSIGKDSLDKEKNTTNVVLEKKVQNIIPPTLEMVKEYCESRNNGIDPQHFIDFYSSKGWVIGKAKMKDWQAAVRTWEGKRKQETKNEWWKE